jgi:hypothetical protein
MTDFVKALKRGFEEVDRVWDARREVDGIFSQLAKATSDVTDGAVRLEIVRRQRRAADESDQIVAVSASDRREPIIDFRQAHAGYPIELEPFNSTESYVCSNKEDLEQALAELLANIHIAERIRALATADAAE